MPVLKANVGGVWVPISAGPSQSTVGLEAAKPVVPVLGQMRYFATDTKRDWLYDGTGWIVMGEPVQSYTPSFGTFTGTSTATYQRSNGLVDFVVHFTLSSAVDGPVTMTLPFAGALNHRDWGHLVLLSAGVNVWAGALDTISAGNSAVGLLTTFAQAPYQVYNSVNRGGGPGGVPFVWKAGDFIQASGRYRMNSRYS